MKLREACLYGQRVLKEAGIGEAGLDAWYLLEFASHIRKSHYLAYPEEELSQEAERKFLEILKKRAARVPLQQLTGEQEFMGLSFAVSDQVLIPRQDTEILVEEVLKDLRPGMRFLDLCTGSGCILFSLLHFCPQAEGVGSDISQAALLVAKKNKERLGKEARLIKSDLFEKIEGSFDLIVSNPPYIRSEEIQGLMEEVRLYEPCLALDGHEDGLYFYRRIVEESTAYLKRGGRLYFEIGYDQGVLVPKLLEERGFREIEVVRDLAGLDRVVKGSWPGEA